MNRFFFTSAVAMTLVLPLSIPAVAKVTSYKGSVQTVGEAPDAIARGTVFLDNNRNSQMDTNEAGVAGVMVSNGREVVVTDDLGRYELPAYDDMNLFITKPAGFATPLDDFLVPQFNYIHKIAGSPELRFGGIDPTGPLPAEINFPLIADNSARDGFECLAFGDAQPYDNTQIGYVRETVGKMLTNRDMSNTECLLFEGDVMGDDLSLYPRFKRIIAAGDTPQYYVGGNHDLDFDAQTDQHSFDTFRREWGPEYYSFDIGSVHFVVLDNVRYPCNGIDPHDFCSEDRNTTYNGVITGRQLEWLANNLALVPEDKLIVLNAHIPFQTFTDNTAAKHQTDNLAELVAILGDRKVLGLSGHTHTVENIEIGEEFEGWKDRTGVGPAPFHQIVTGAISGSWWAGDLNDAGVPDGQQRLGAPRGFFSLAFDGADYVDTYKAFAEDQDEQLHASFNTPRFRNWAEDIFAYLDLYGSPSDVIPPVTVNDLGDMYMLTAADLAGGTWVVVNVWNGSRASEVSVTINQEQTLPGVRTQSGAGEAKNRGIDYADPLAMSKQATVSRMTVRSARGGEDTAGFSMFQGSIFEGVAGPLPVWLQTNSSSHLWRVDLPETLPLGLHVMDVATIDRHGRRFVTRYPFEVVDRLPEPRWQSRFFD